MTEPAPARLIVLRHAKSAWPDVVDWERPLAPKGREDSPAAGRWLRENGCVPDLVICSTSRRTRETWELVAPELESKPDVVFERRAYRADPEELVELVQEVPESARTVLLVGHRPEVQDLVVMLASAENHDIGQSEDPLRRVSEQYPTAAIAVLELPGTWAELAPGAARLTAFAVPRGSSAL